MDKFMQLTRRFLFEWFNEKGEGEAARQAQTAYTNEFEAFWKTLSAQDRTTLENIASLHDDYAEEQALNHFLLGCKMGARFVFKILRF